MSASSPRVGVVIPNWNGLSHLPGCLSALAAQTFTDFEVVLVDNASSDGSVQWVRERHPEVRIVERSDNGGFSKAVNAGISATQGEYVALLNNDTVADAGWLEALVEALDEHAAYDFAAAKLVLFDDPERLNAAGDIYALWRLAGANRGIGDPVARYDRMERVLGACAAAVLYRRTLFDAVGLYDEDFFLISEDTDLNLRSLIAGKRCLYVPTALVWHKHGASIKNEPPWEMRRLQLRNDATVAAKDLPSVVLPLFPIMMLYRLFRQTVPLRPSKWHLFPGLLCQAPERLRIEWEGFRLGWAKRPEVWSLKAVGTLEILRWLLRGSGPE